VVLAYFHPSGSDMNTFAEHLIDHLNLTGSTASLVHDVFGNVFVMITMSLMCAVFSPVWANWRRTEKDRRADESPPGADGWNVLARPR